MPKQYLNSVKMAASKKTILCFLHLLETNSKKLENLLFIIKFYFPIIDLIKSNHVD